ncbi:hypothetical protein KIS4809_0901 [Bacillus sp. ZZV12-4809]|nr:hypothetical protein KIS4809_0901 [Bacillus sp. ZZV12-4809]
MRVSALKDTLIIYHTTLLIAIVCFQENFLDIGGWSMSYNRDKEV